MAETTKEGSYSGYWQDGRRRYPGSSLWNDWRAQIKKQSCESSVRAEARKTVDLVLFEMFQACECALTHLPRNQERIREENIEAHSIETCHESPFLDAGMIMILKSVECLVI